MFRKRGLVFQIKLKGCTSPQIKGVHIAACIWSRRARLRGDQRGVKGRCIFDFAGQFAGLFDDAVDRRTVVPIAPSGRFAELAGMPGAEQRTL